MGQTALSAARNLRKFGVPLNSDPSASGKWGSEFPQIPSRGAGRLAGRASWDRDLPGRTLGSGP
eukprot:11503343-Alexandrium_andersonii.AAC.1